jgi:hypothetical protein
MNNINLTKKETESIKSINISKLEALLCEYYKDHVLIENSDLKKKPTTFTTFTASSYSYMGEPEYMYEQAVIDLYKLKAIIEKL